MDRKLKTGILAVLIANLINVCFSLLTNFLLPKYLPIDSYAAIKTFQLYTSYVGLLHFGYIDGMYLKYGGIDLGYDIKDDLSLNLSTMKVFQVILTALFLAISCGVGDSIIILFSLSILPQNMINYFKYLYQATGEFPTYGRLMNLTTISSFALNIVLLLIVRTEDYLVYLCGYVIVFYLIWLLLEVQFNRTHLIAKTKIFSWKELLQNIRSGFLLTLGNLASMLLTSMDRWFVKFLLYTIDFAQYSFAVSVEGFLSLAITPLTTTLYNFFCRERDEDKHRSILRHIWVFATILPAAAFPVKLILELFLEKYLEACNVIFLLFSAQMFYIIIRSVFLNLYKMQKKQNRYFLKLLFVLGVGFVFNYICFWIMHNKEAFALGTLLSAIVWYIISVIDFKYLKITIYDYIYLISELIVFLLCGFYFNAILGFLVFIVFTMVMIYIFRKDSLKAIRVEINNVMKKSRSRV